ncbi:MAG: CPBP family intramembrane metalloprotease [Clostridia bacterium]|nr:CPBP family intramembrane metalloprotease [Clostridia bacterium]
MNENIDLTVSTEPAYDFKKAKKVFSRIGLGLFCIIAVTYLLQSILLVFAELLPNMKSLTSSSWWVWGISFVPMYLVAVPVCLLIFRKIRPEAPQSRVLKALDLLALIPISFAITYTGNIIGTLLSLLLSGGRAENEVINLVMDAHPFAYIIVAVIAPVIEEFLFRKQIIDRTRKYGEKNAVFLSALTFGLFHMNLYQFFYAFALGWVFAYIYIRTGRLRYTIILHAVINFFGSVVSTYIMALGVYAYLLYFLFVLMLWTVGIALIFMYKSKIKWEQAELELPMKTSARVIYLNTGMILFTLSCIALIIFSLL